MATYLVTGATGHQGGAVVTSLLASGAKVHAVVRDPTSPASLALQQKGVTLFQGNFESPDPSFKLAAASCTGIFLNPSFFDPSVAQGQASAILAACRAGAGPGLMTTVVLSSTTRVQQWSDSNFRDTVTGIDPMLGYYYGAKAGVEAAVREAEGFKHYTILRPGVLHYDYMMPVSAFAVPDLPRRAEIWHSLEDGAVMPHTDENDVGKYAAAALLEADRFSGEEFALASENLSAEDVASIMGRVSGVEVKVHKRTKEEVQQTMKSGTPTQKFELLQGKLPARVDTEAVQKKYGIKLATLEEYLTRNKEALLESLPPKTEGKF
ncbi:uncharacterized protein HMPREF1541_07616 [Cyphellophora europaea CBS 101466]|uniref:NmrA-like domain-containing protein n=1 Tax=Cyphellophora europaea (strain CBS 101466) TaxID=1220924 RepID=W2RQL0_CYPE1|nr:uncharacterized protein HMPREF1541_07616 [Cyphellophora europaea CBS 101466]ETN37993.1 hypothetical protein HMPREF1541_07616 [Cyphellophora europaea CBS 101466]